jgi:hypothetical protein
MVSPQARRLVVDLLHPDDGGATRLQFWAQVEGREWVGQLGLAELYRCLSDVEDGLSASLEIDGETAIVPAGAELVELPIGPFAVGGSLEQWRDMIDRELADPAPAPGRPVTREPWLEDRIAFPVVESE